MSKVKQAPKIELSDLEQQMKFDAELAWCISKINNGLANEKDSRKIMDAQKLLRQLQSPATPLVKKRQLMSHHFGDYRTKMKQEETALQKNQQQRNNRIKFVDHVDEKQMNKSKCLKKKSSSSNQHRRDDDGDDEKSLVNHLNEKLLLVNSTSPEESKSKSSASIPFAFNFQIPQ